MNDCPNCEYLEREVMETKGQIDIWKSAAVRAQDVLAEPGGTLTIAQAEGIAVDRALAATHGNRTHASRVLGISIRTLRNILAARRGTHKFKTKGIR